MKTSTLTCTIAIAALTLSGTAGAAEWYLTPRVSLRSGYNDNLTITTRPHNGVEELDLTPGASFGRKTQTTGITGHVQFNGRHYWGQSGLNTNDGLFGLHLYDNGQRMTWTLDGNITRDTTLQSELNATGLVLGRTPRVSRSLSPTWTYMFSPQTRLSLNYQHQDVRYPDQTIRGYADYQINTGSATVTHQYNPRLQLFATGSVTYYRTTRNRLPTGTNFKAQYETVQAGASYAFTHRLSASLSAGATRSTTVITEQRLEPIVTYIPFVGPYVLGYYYSNPFEVGATRTGSTLNASLQEQFETGTLGTTLTRSLQPTGLGGLVETDHLQLSATHNISVKFNESVDLGVYRTAAVTSTLSGLDRTFITLEPTFTWNMTRWWHLAGSYRYERQRYKNQSETATANAVYLTLSYAWPRIAVSR